ncbi:MAG: Eco57I restriction-modification methylase domain-containing protein, partial [Bacteroidetes bacterium]|nr:Eco57I restriction-modification methylase domain-containing protein [Bacteroidota bacterium]
VGFATETELQKGLTYTLDGVIAKPLIEEKCEIVANAFKRYKDIQLTYGDDFKEFKKAKAELNQRLQALNNELNTLLAKEYGIDYDPKSSKSCESYESWLRQYLPFHWFAEFYEIVQENGGFDVIIGNPPYVEYSKIDYKLTGYNTIKCGNLYAFVIERSKSLSTSFSRIGMIIPISSICTDRMIDYQKLVHNGHSWNSLYAERPSKLFSGAEVQLVITILSNSIDNKMYSSTYNKWSVDYRDFLFDNVSYVSIQNLIRKGSLPKIGSQTEISILSKLMKQKKSISHLQTKNTRYFVSYRNAGGRYYKVILNYEPDFKINGEQKRSSTYQFLYFESQAIADAFCAIMNSGLFFWYWLMFSDTWHMVNREIGSFPIELDSKLILKLSSLNRKLMEDLRHHSISRIENRNKGVDKVEFTQFNVRESKPIIDEIDTILAKHYDFTNEELDFIINYDIKNRMGKELSEPGFSQDDEDEQDKLLLS